MQSDFARTVAPKTHQAEIRTISLQGDLPLGKAARTAMMFGTFSRTVLHMFQRPNRRLSRH